MVCAPRWSALLLELAFLAAVVLLVQGSLMRGSAGVVFVAAGATIGLLTVTLGVLTIIGRRIGTPWHFTP